MNKVQPSSVETPDLVNFERLTFLVDGVFAITLTLLVLELRPPEGNRSELLHGLVAMLPRLFIYLLAFYSIANYWVVQQRMFHHITKANTVMAWQTLLGLLFITLIPATTALVGSYPGVNWSLACFSANSFLYAFAQWGFWHYVKQRNQWFASNSDPRLLSISARVWFIISLGWMLASLLSFINPTATYVSWILFPNLEAQWAKHQRQKINQGMTPKPKKENLKK